MKAESISAYDGPGDVLTPYANVPSSKDGEFSARGVNAVVADLNAPSFCETSRSPVDGDASRSQSRFRTSDSTKRS